MNGFNRRIKGLTSKGGINLIKKELIIPSKIIIYEAALRRLKKEFPKRKNIEEDLAKSYAGYRGELSLDYYFNLLPSQDCYILHNLRLPNVNGIHFFQMDILFMTPCFLLIIEVKNISGALTFDPALDQVIWKTTEKEIALPDPVRQVKNQQYQLIEWLKLKKLPPIPVESIVVLTNPSTIIKILSDKRDYIQSIIRSPRVLSKIVEFKRRYTKELINTREMNKISNLLIKHHSPAVPDLREKYNVKASDLLTGVYCDMCFSLKMKYYRGGWKCERCAYSNREGHLHALKDYVLLFQPTITNQKLREYLHLPNSDIAYYLLKSMDLSHSGNFKNREYYLPIIELD